MADLNTIGGLHYEMMRRCYNPNCKLYPSYGGAGITVCEQWHDRNAFRKWALENGYTKGMRLNRKDSSGNYDPDNCFFGTDFKAKHGKNQAIKAKIKENKDKKKSAGVERITDSPLYKTHQSMLTRCYNANHTHFKDYGGRGITVCDEWKGENGVYAFIAWSKKSGWKPGLTLDRIDNSKGYSPNNCRWATQKEQIRNRRNTVFYNYKGYKLTASEIAEAEGVPPAKLRYRLKNGLSVNEAIEAIKRKE